jgi:hypothetical protein
MDAKNALLGVFVILTIIFASSTLIEHGQVTTLTTTTTVISTTTAAKASTCSPAANQENPLMTFRIHVEYNGPWNATAIGYSNTAANQAFLKCYSSKGNGWILISDWISTGGAILNLTVQKMDVGSGKPYCYWEQSSKKHCCSLWEQ